MSAGVKVKSPSDRPLTANEVDADPSILRNPGTREKTRSRSGQKGGASKARFPDDEPHIRQRFVMMESPAWKALSLSARRVLDRIEIEFGRHKGRPESNGELVVTYEDFVEYGITRRLVRPALNEVIALGFVRVTREGVAGNADQRQSTMYLITYQHAGSAQYLEDNWKRIKSDEEAEALAKAARKRKGNLRARELGRKGAAAAAASRRAKNAIPVPQSVPTPVSQSVPQTGQNGTFGAAFPVPQSVPLSRISRGRAIDADDETRGTKATYLDELATLPWCAPRRAFLPVVWPIDVAFPVNGHSIDMPGSPRVIIRGESVQ
jgi:hypothetical protein